MGIFDNIGSAQYFETGKYIQPGYYAVEVLKVKQGKTRKGEPFFVTEMKILETSNADQHPANTEANWMVMLKHDAALGNIRHFLSVASGTAIDDVQAADAEEATGEANPLQGIKLRVSAINVKTRADKDFTKVKFMPMTVSAAEAAAQHEEFAAS